MLHNGIVRSSLMKRNGARGHPHVASPGGSRAQMDLVLHGRARMIDGSATKLRYQV